MLNNKFVLYSFNLFFRYHPIKLIILFIVTILQSLSQGVSIVLLIPLLALLDPKMNGGLDNKWANFLGQLTEACGLSITLSTVLFFFLGLLLWVVVLNYWQSVLQSSYQQGFSYEIRQRLFSKIINSEWRFFNKRSKHSHIQILTTEVPKMATYYSFYLGLTTKTLFILSHLVIACFLSIWFTLFVLALSVVILFVLRSYLKKSGRLGRANIVVFKDVLKRIDDFWATIKVAKVHHSEEYYLKKFNESNLKMIGFQNKLVYNRAISTLWFMFLGILSLIGMIYVAYTYFHLSFSLLLILILLFSRIFPQFVSLNNDLNLLCANAASVELIFDLDRDLDSMQSIKDMEWEADEVNLKKEIVVSHLNFGYDHPLFVDFNMVIPANRITGILGNSGSGKTTLIDILAGLQPPESGMITVDDYLLTDKKWAAWRKKMGYLPQDSFFIDGSIRENILWDTVYPFADREIEEVLRSVNAYDLVMRQKDGLDTVISNYQFHFSGGERQRLALARVLLRKPQLLLLDEATSSLDAENERIIVDCLTHLKEEVTIVFVTHHRYLQSFFDAVIDLDEYKRS